MGCSIADDEHHIVQIDNYMIQSKPLRKDINIEVIYIVRFHNKFNVPVWLD